MVFIFAHPILAQVSVFTQSERNLFACDETPHTGRIEKSQEYYFAFMPHRMKTLRIQQTWDATKHIRVSLAHYRRLITPKNNTACVCFFFLLSSAVEREWEQRILTHCMPSFVYHYFAPLRVRVWICCGRFSVWISQSLLFSPSLHIEHISDREYIWYLALSACESFVFHSILLPISRFGYIEAVSVNSKICHFVPF